MTQIPFAARIAGFLGKKPAGTTSNVPVEKAPSVAPVTTNPLYPIFLKMDRFQTLIVGGGEVALEKLTFLLKSSSNAQVTLVAPEFREELFAISEGLDVQFVYREFAPLDLEGIQMVIAATDSYDVNFSVYELCKEAGILVNVADTPPLCDFYLGGIVTKGPLKIAISTNGTSPTLAKRMRQIFEAELPDKLEDLTNSLNRFRKTLRGDFAEKVDKLNELTKGLVG